MYISTVLTKSGQPNEDYLLRNVEGHYRLLIAAKKFKYLFDTLFFFLPHFMCVGHSQIMSR